ncbi:tetratricopeptide repeat protein [Wolbachia endosymbiont of Kerria lacca]|uniref:tetratricopeptide repeat protein n=1 Tax=Wolbachia endosymbiont of Kerria lacca TaxID=427705 RepID=UPI003F664262
MQKVQELLKAGVKVSIIDKNNKDNTPLHYAIEREKEEIAKKLLQEWKADINVKNNKGDTPLHVATSKGNKELVQLLVSKKAKTDIINNNNETPLDIAKKHDTPNGQDIVQILKPHIQSNLQASARQPSTQHKRTRTDSEEVESEDSSHKMPRTSLQAAEESRGRKRTQNEENELGAGQVKKLKTSEGYRASGLKTSFHGTVYQLKLLMLFLKRGLDQGYSFNLATEMDAAEKFDDVVFQYTEGGEEVYRFLQAKHKQDDNKKITVNDLLTEQDDEFSLQKYFISYRKIKQNPKFKGYKLKDFVICTNIDLEESLRNSFEPVEGEDNILRVNSEKSERLKLKVDKFPNEKDLVSRLRKTSEINRLAKRLAKCVLENDPLDLKDNLFRSYHGVLGEKVIDVKNVEQREEKDNKGKEIKKSYAKFRSNFLDGSSQELENFRSAFLKAYQEMSKEQMNVNEFWQKMKARELQISQTFGKVFELDINPQLTNSEVFAKAIANAMSVAEQSVVNIKREKGKGIIKDNINKLAGHVLIKKGDKEKDAYYFSSTFFDDNNKLPGNLESFKNELKAELESKVMEFDKDKYKFHIANFKTCEEEQLHLKTFLPDDYIDEEEIDDFLDKLVFAVNQPNEVELGEIIKDELGKEFNTIDRRNVYGRFLEKMLDWMKDKKGKFFTHEEGEAFFEEIKKEILGAIWFDVRYPVDLFTGREEELKSLHSKIQRSSGRVTIISQMTSISGLGGIGKTELARKYAYDHENDYDGNVIWINAESEGAIKSSFIRLAKDKLGINTKDADRERKDIKSIVEDVYRFFSKRKSLFVFDNAEKNEYFKKFLPLRSLTADDNKPYILITSRNRELEGEVVNLNELKLEDAIEFIKKGLSIPKEDKSQDQEVEGLLKKLQRFPLAIQQAIAYIKDQRVTRKFGINDYLQEYEKKAKDLLDSGVFQGIDNEYERTTFTTWEVTIDKIASNKEYGELAVKVLNTVAYLAPEDIKREMFSKLAGNDETKLESAVRLLVRYSMVNGEEKQSVLSVHRLVQEVTRIKLKGQDKNEEVIKKTFELLGKSFPYGEDKQKDYDKKRQLLPHLEALLSHVDDWAAKKPKDKEELEKDYLVYLLTWMSDGYSDLGNPEKQKELLERALPILEKYYGGENVEVAITLGNLGNAYGDLGNPEKQKELLERALAIEEKYYGGEHVEVASTLGNLGNAYGALGNPEKQKELLERALPILEKYYGGEHFQVARTLGNLGAAYGALGNPEKQKELLERALAIEEKYYGGENVEVAITLGNLGNAYGDLGNPEKQKELLERALAIEEKYYGGEHVEVASTLGNLGNAYGALGNPEKQKELLERALAIEEKYYGGENVEVASTLGNLGNAYGALGNPEKKKELLERALAIEEKYYGGEHVEVASTLGNLGNAYGALGNPEKQKELLERALAIEEKYYGGEHVEVASTLGNLGNAYGALGNPEKKKELLERALPIFEKHNHPVVARLKIELEKLSSVESLRYAAREGNLNRDNGVTQLHYAAQNGNAENIKLLLKNGADIETTDINGWTPLHDAAHKNSLNAVSALLDGGANINAVSQDNKKPIDYTTYDSIKKVLKSTQELFASIRQKQNESRTKELLRRGASVNAVSGTDRLTVSHFAVSNGELAVIKALLEKRPNINAVDVDGWTPLHYAAQDGHLDIVKLLLDRGADPTIRNSNEKTPLQLAEEHLNQNPEVYQGIVDILKQKSIQQGVKVSAEECLPSTSSGRSKREAIGEKCLFTWEDIDEFNEEKDDRRDLSKIRIDGEKFISYIKDLPEEKQSQLIQLADKVKVTGESQSLVNKLIGNQKVISHLNRVGRVSGITMHGMMAKNVLADFLNSNYQGVAVNVGFIAGGQGFAKVAEAASLKGLKLAEEGKLLIGQSLKAASPFLARGTSAFVIYDLVNQIKAFKNGTEEALVGVVGDSIYLGVDAAEIGVEVAEAFGVLEGVSSVTGPIGAAIGAVVFVGTDIYMAVKRVDKIDQIVHLTGNEKFVEGLRAFIGMKPEQYIEELMEKKQLYNQLVKQGLEYLKGHSDIQSYVFPTTDSKFKPDLDSKVLLDRKRTGIRWSRARPDDLNEGRVFCLPQGNDEPAPNYGSYLCENAIGIFANKTGDHTLINLGEGKDYVKGFLNSPNIFVVNDGYKKFTGGNKDDLFILMGNTIEGMLYGEGGIDTLDLSEFAQEAVNVNVYLNASIGYITYGDSLRNGPDVLRMVKIERVLGRKAKSELIFSSCDTQFLDGQGSAANSSDVIIIKNEVENNVCTHKVQIVVRPNTNIRNQAHKGEFNYVILPGKGEAVVNISSLLDGTPTDRHDFFFNSTISDLIGIYVQNVSQVFNHTVKSVTFSFLSAEDKLESSFDNQSNRERFNLTISDCIKQDLI